MSGYLPDAVPCTARDQLARELTVFNPAYTEAASPTDRLFGHSIGHPNDGNAMQVGTFD
jgi:hypothetical protein